jgi:hypothetical protein
MAAYTVAAGEIGAHEKTLVASTVDTVTFTGELSDVDIRVLNEGSTGIYWTIDGRVPTVGAATANYLPPNSVAVIAVGSSAGTVVTLISSGTPKYSVSKDL